MKRKQKFRLHKVLEKGCVRDSEDVGMQIMKQSYESSKGRLVGTDNFAFRIPAMGSKQLRKTQCMYMQGLHRKRKAPHKKNDKKFTTTAYATQDSASTTVFRFRIVMWISGTHPLR
jgi:hypothetical protein